jgi:signal transduction histidine kinase
LLSLQKKKEAGSQGHRWRIERSLERDCLVRAAFHALWLRGLRAPARWRYGVAIVAALVPSLLRIVMDPYWGLRFLYAAYFPATLFTALFGGLGPAWVGIGICAVLTTAWILPPIGSLSVSDPIDLLGLAVFLVADGIIAWIGASHRDLIEQRELQNAELEAACRAKDDFLAVLSHELRTPLTTIVAGIRVLGRIGSPDERASHTREAIERQADHLARMVDDLLDMKKIVAGVVVLERRPCDLADAVTGFIAMLNEAGRFKGHTLSVDAEPVWVNGDVTRLHQVVVNLLGNAIKYTPAGGSIHVSVKCEGDDAVLRVRDSGIGISPDLPPRMFDLFVQGDPGSERVRSGLGDRPGRRPSSCRGSRRHRAGFERRPCMFTVRLPRIPTPSA